MSGHGGFGPDAKSHFASKVTKATLCTASIGRSVVARKSARRRALKAGIGTTKSGAVGGAGSGSSSPTCFSPQLRDAAAHQSPQRNPRERPEQRRAGPRRPAAKETKPTKTPKKQAAPGSNKGMANSPAAAAASPEGMPDRPLPIGSTEESRLPPCQLARYCARSDHCGPRTDAMLSSLTSRTERLITWSRGLNARIGPKLQGLQGVAGREASLFVERPLTHVRLRKLPARVSGRCRASIWAFEAVPTKTWPDRETKHPTPAWPAKCLPTTACSRKEGSGVESDQLDV